jgi:hypothetical protein
MMLRIKLLDSNGRYVTTIQAESGPKEKSVEPWKDYRHDVVLPLTSHSWFMPIPAEVDINGAAVPVPLPEGQYKATVGFGASSFWQNKEDQTIPERPNYETLMLEFPTVTIDVNPKMLSSENLIERYAAGTEAQPHR